MRTILIAAAAILGCGTDGPTDPGPDAGVEFCKSSTLPEYRAEWDACRSANVDSWPVFCAGAQVPEPCVFTVEMNGDTVLCRPAGACE